MFQLTGMDIGQIRALADQMRREAAGIEQMLTTLTSELEGVPWRGQDRQMFLDEWRVRHVASLRRVVESLESAACQASEHARQQEWASKA